MIRDEIKELKAKYGNEKVLIVENKILDSWMRTEKDMMLALEHAVRKRGFYALRYEVELDSYVRQVIPYVVLKCNGKFFITKRLKGDTRLVGQYSIGVGGHVDVNDHVRGRGMDIINFDPTIRNCIMRELKEETTFDEVLDCKYEDTFIDDSTDVSKHHICILTIVNCQNEVEVKETDTLSGMWVTKEELAAMLGDGTKFENWSIVAMDKLGIKDTVSVKPAKQPKKKGAKR